MIHALLFDSQRMANGSKGSQPTTLTLDLPFSLQDKVPFHVWEGSLHQIVGDVFQSTDFETIREPCSFFDLTTGATTSSQCQVLQKLWSRYIFHQLQIDLCAKNNMKPKAKNQSPNHASKAAVSAKLPPLLETYGLHHQLQLLHSLQLQICCSACQACCCRLPGSTHLN